jgi:hypothetical protein
MTLATADRTGRPYARVVLLKDCDADGFVFFHQLPQRQGPSTCGESPSRSCFSGWSWSDRCGSRVLISQISAAESEAYFRTRPRESRLGRAGIAAESGRRQPPDSRPALRTTGRPISRRQYPNALSVGRLSPAPGNAGVLAGSSWSDARPFALSAAKRGLGGCWSDWNPEPAVVRELVQGCCLPRLLVGWFAPLAAVRARSRRPRSTERWLTRTASGEPMCIYISSGAQTCPHCRRARPFIESLPSSISLAGAT